MSEWNVFILIVNVKIISTIDARIFQTHFSLIVIMAWCSTFCLCVVTSAFCSKYSFNDVLPTRIQYVYLNGLLVRNFTFTHTTKSRVVNSIKHRQVFNRGEILSEQTTVINTVTQNVLSGILSERVTRMTTDTDRTNLVKQSDSSLNMYTITAKKEYTVINTTISTVARHLIQPEDLKLERLTTTGIPIYGQYNQTEEVTSGGADNIFSKTTAYILISIISCIACALFITLCVFIFQRKHIHVTTTTTQSDIEMNVFETAV